MGQFSVEICALPGSILNGNQHAIVIGCSEGTVKSRVSRGREALADLMTRTTGPKTNQASVRGAPRKSLESLLQAHLYASPPFEKQTTAGVAAGPETLQALIPTS